MIRTRGHHLTVRNGYDDRINTRIRAQGRATRVYLEVFAPLRGCRNHHRTDCLRILCTRHDKIRNCTPFSTHTLAAHSL